MKKIFLTNRNNASALAARLALGIVVFPHGAQKLLGWFGGKGFEGTMEGMTNGMGLPYIIALLVILIESFGALFLIAGFATRLAAFGIFVNFAGVVIIKFLHSSFFMNWGSKPDTGEGLEYFILLFGLAMVSLIAGGGMASIDAGMIKTKRQTILF